MGWTARDEPQGARGESSLIARNKVAVGRGSPFRGRALLPSIFVARAGTGTAWAAGAHNCTGAISAPGAISNTANIPTTNSGPAAAACFTGPACPNRAVRRKIAHGGSKGCGCRERALARKRKECASRLVGRSSEGCVRPRARRSPDGSRPPSGRRAQQGNSSKHCGS